MIRTSNGPAVMAALRAIAILELHGWTSIAKASRHHSHQVQRSMTTLGITYPNQTPRPKRENPGALRPRRTVLRAPRHS